MPGEPEAGDVGQRVHRRHIGERLARRVELRGPLQHLGIAGGRELAFLERRRKDADAERLAENQRIAGPGRTIFFDFRRMDEAERDQAVDRLERIDRMAAGDRDLDGRAHRFTAREDAADRRHRQLLERHADDGERHDRPPAHRVDVGDGVGRGDAAEIERIVDDGRKEVRGRHQRLRVVQLVHRRIVGSLGAHHELSGQAPYGARAQDLRQDGRGDLAATAAAVAELGEADLFGCVHGCILQVRKPAKTSPRSAI